MRVFVARSVPVVVSVVAVAAITVASAFAADTAPVAPAPAAPASAPASAPAAVPVGSATPAAPGKGAAGSATGSVAGLVWMSGCWEATGGEGKVFFQEMWMKPAGGTMIGAGRTLASGRTIFTENLEIREGADGVIYRARPQDAATPVPFKLAKQTEGSVVFENPAHDFPTRIVYERLPDGGLRARVDGPPGSREKAQEFLYRRVACE